MAIRLIDRYPNRAEPASQNYPDGAFRNKSEPTADDGTPLEEDWGNDYAAFFQALLEDAGITPDGNVDTVPDSQRMDALYALAGARTVDSVSGLRTASFRDSVERIWLSGYYGAGTPGGGPLYRDSNDTTTADNGGTVFVDSDDVRWKRPITGAWNLSWFGSTGDGVTDDSSAIQSAIDSLPSVGGTVVLGEPGDNFLISSTITVDKKAKLVGHGYSEVDGVSAPTIIAKSGTLSGPALLCTGFGAQLIDFSLDCETGNTGDGIVIEAGRVYVGRVSVFNAGQDGIRIGRDTGVNANLWRLDTVLTKSNGRHGVHITGSVDPGVTLPDTNAGTLIHLDTQNNASHGLMLGNTIGNIFVNVTAQTNNGDGIHLTPNAEDNAFYGGDIDENNVNNNLEIETGALRNMFFGMRVTAAKTLDAGTDTLLLNEEGVYLGRTLTKFVSEHHQRSVTLTTTGEVVDWSTAPANQWLINGVGNSLSDISNMPEGTMLTIICTLGGTDTLTVVHNTNAIRLVGGTDFTMGGNDSLTLVKRGPILNEVSRADH